MQDVHRVVTRRKETRRQPENRGRMAPIQKLFRDALAFACTKHEPGIVLRSGCVFSGDLQRSRAGRVGRIRIRQGPRERSHQPRI
ncbi:hypothetical protein AKJ09_06013 [Labilithrix luteola]|uniref:Uncharacterized protein n=1 Tax=Labilithrix luteola TaxID=1391654 RepID=A0A0K1Q1V4_9BACT|nr:hypothetical protein AKJ09_06013 [Labilithrix luteola]